MGVIANLGVAADLGVAVVLIARKGSLQSTHREAPSPATMRTGSSSPWLTRCND
jgi:hypothetical protein